MAKYNSFEETEVYIKALDFVVNVYKLIDANEQIAKNYGFKDQLQRSALSISNNIAEGFERETKKELIRFLYISKGSAGECINMFNVLRKLDYISDELSNHFRQEILEISKQLGNYIKFLKKLENQNKKTSL
jgi:four helix bundle protein